MAGLYWNGWDRPCGDHDVEFCEECVELHACEIAVRRNRLRRNTSTGAQHRAAADMWTETDYVFTTPTGGPLNPNTDYHTWNGSWRTQKSR